jgi:hypothetical protein
VSFPTEIGHVLLRRILFLAQQSWLENQILFATLDKMCLKFFSSGIVWGEGAILGGIQRSPEPER